MWGIKKVKKKKRDTEEVKDGQQEFESEEEGLLESDNEEQEECMTPRKDGRSRDYIPEVSESTAKELIAALMMTNGIMGANSTNNEAGNTLKEAIQKVLKAKSDGQEVNLEETVQGVIKDMGGLGNIMQLVN